MEIISPVAIGLISDPPTLVVSYDCIPRYGEKRKRRKRKMPIRDFTDRSNVKRFVFNLRQRHTKYLADIVDVTIEKMLRVIQEIQKGNSVERSLEIVSKEYKIDPNEDLNKLSPAQIALRKAVMDETFHKNLVKPGDPGFVYDREVKFDLQAEKSDGDEWDEDSEKKSNTELMALNDTINDKFLQSDNAFPFLSNEMRRNSDHAVDFPLIASGGDAEQSMVLQTAKIKQTMHAMEKAEEKVPGNDSDVTKVSPEPLAGAVSQERNAAEADPLGESSSDNDIEAALVNIESGAIDDEDEDFWT